VAKIEESIAAGKLDAGTKALEKLKEDKDAKTAKPQGRPRRESRNGRRSVDAEMRA